MKCEHCEHKAEYFIVIGVFCGATFTLCHPCKDVLWTQHKRKVERGAIPWTQIPIGILPTMRAVA